MATKHSEVETLGEYAYVSDIVNNTMCADLLDYLKRDIYFCNLQESFGDRFLRYLYLDYLPVKKPIGKSVNARRLIIRLWKKETLRRHRRDVLSELVDLLRTRYSLGEKVYFHNAKSSSSAMIARAVWSAMNPERGPVLPLAKLYEIGDDQLLALLADAEDPVASKLANSLLRRELFKLAYTLGRPEAEASPSLDWMGRMVRDFHQNPESRTATEDQLASLCGLQPGDVLIYCPQPDMAKKYARMLVEWKEEHIELQDIDDPATKPALDAILKSHDLLWGLHVFVIPSAREDEKTWRKLRGLCEWRFAPASQPQDSERRLEAALTLIVQERMGSRGTSEDPNKVVTNLLAKHRSSGSADIKLENVDRAITEVVGD